MGRGRTRNQPIHFPHDLIILRTNFNQFFQLINIYDIKTKFPNYQKFIYERIKFCYHIWVLKHCLKAFYFVTRNQTKASYIGTEIFKINWTRRWVLPQMLFSGKTIKAHPFGTVLLQASPSSRNFNRGFPLFNTCIHWKANIIVKITGQKFTGIRQDIAV